MIHGSIESGNAPELKEALFGALDYAALEVLRAGHPVVYDAQHRTRADRQHTTAVALEAGVPSAVVWMKTPRDIAIERVGSRESTHDQLQLSRKEAEALIFKAEEKFEDFVDGEKVIEIDGTAEFEAQYRQLMNNII